MLTFPRSSSVKVIYFPRNVVTQELACGQILGLYGMVSTRVLGKAVFLLSLPHLFLKSSLWSNAVTSSDICSHSQPPGGGMEQGGKNMVYTCYLLTVTENWGILCLALEAFAVSKGVHSY